MSSISSRRSDLGPLRVWAVLAGLPALLLTLGCSLNPPLRVADLVESPAAVELHEVPFHPQEAHHCGPASLQTLLEASGLSVDYQSVVDRVFVPGLEGSLQAEMSAAPRTLGRISYRLEPQVDAVLREVEAGRPVLVLQNLGVPSKPAWHYAVVVGFDAQSNRIVLRSGTTERDVQRARPWLRRWEWAGRWAMVVLRPGELPTNPDRERLLEALAAFEDSASAEEAGRAWVAAVDLWREEPIAWLGVGNAAARGNDLAGGIDAYRRALELDPESLPARLNLAVALADNAQPCAAIELLHEAPDTGHPLEHTFAATAEEVSRQCTATVAAADSASTDLE